MPCHTIPVLSRRSALLCSTFLPLREALNLQNCFKVAARDLWPLAYRIKAYQQEMITIEMDTFFLLLCSEWNTSVLLSEYCTEHTTVYTACYSLQNTMSNRSPHFKINASKLLSNDLITLHTSYHLGKHIYLYTNWFIIDILTVVHQKQKFIQKEFPSCAQWIVYIC